MPSLEALTWTVPTCDLLSRSTTELSRDFGLPASLHRLDLSILWDHDEDQDHPNLDLSLFTALGWHAKLTNLRIKSSWDPRDYTNSTAVADVQFGDGKLPMLESLHCEAFDLSGTLHAPQLKHLTLYMEGEDDIQWMTFQHCRKLEHIALYRRATLDCLGCSFPGSLVDLTLQVGRLLEDGCFSIAPPHLGSLRLAFDVCASDVIDLRAFTSKGADVKVDAGVLQLSMPPQHDSQSRSRPRAV